MKLSAHMVPLGEMFEFATRQSIDEWGLARRLLQELKGPLTAFGYRRQFTFLDNGEPKERLPRDTHRQPIPQFHWLPFDDVSGALASRWLDDPEMAEYWATMDWVSGHFEATDMEWDSCETILIHFHNIALEAKAARRIMAELAGETKKRPGAPKGPRNEWERAQAQRGFEMIQAGDQRPVTDVAASLIHRDTKANEVGNQKRRILAGIRALMDDAESSLPQ